MFGLTLNLSAQGTMGDREGVGQILEGKKKGKDVVIKMSSQKNPWENQRKFKYVSIKDHEKGKLKGKDWEKMKVKDADGYFVGDREFVKMKYTAVGTALKSGNVNNVTQKVAMVGALAKSTHFIEKLMDGEVEVYRFYNYPPDASATAGADQAAAYDKMIAELRTNYQILIKTGKKGKLKNFKTVKIADLIAGCPEVVDRYNKEEFKMKPKGGSKMMKLALSGKMLEARAMEILGAYNECMAK